MFVLDAPELVDEGVVARLGDLPADRARSRDNRGDGSAGAIPRPVHAAISIRAPWILGHGRSAAVTAARRRLAIARSSANSRCTSETSNERSGTRRLSA